MFPSERPPRSLEGFDILERLGAGGAGEVFLARSRAGRLVAIKTLASAAGGDEALGDVLAREASVCARLRHPCIVQVRALLEEPGFAALVFEYVPGVALGRVLRLGQSRGVRIPDRAAWHIVERVLTALAYAHAFTDDRGQKTPIVHRDVSPANVLLDWSGGVKIADFGIAKVLGVSPATRLGLVKGTLGCMAPEQARGEPVDERADVYAAGLLAWRLATGRSPFGKHHKDEVELMRAMRHPRIKPLGSIRPDLPEALVEVIDRALEPDLARRTIDAEQIAQVVREHVDVRAGWLELASLLEQWKGALEQTVRRAGDRTQSSSSGGRAAHTLRYEEVALAFDDDPPPDGPTFEAHALPSEGTLRAASSDGGADDEGVAPVPPATVTALRAAPSVRPVQPEEAGKRAKRPANAANATTGGAGARRAPVLLWLAMAFAAVTVTAALLAIFGR
jgi:serine/threonine-protein kinase